MKFFKKQSDILNLQMQFETSEGLRLTGLGIIPRSLKTD